MVCAPATGPTSRRTRSESFDGQTKRARKIIRYRDSYREDRRFSCWATFEVFATSALVHDAVIRNLEIVSEASRHVPADLKATAPDIAWREIADFGNLLRHGYEGVNDRILWETIRRDLPPLMTAVRGFLDRPDVE
ncbi:MAG TPA: HepT-like ribonuclease domain-containing protein [Rhizomicrobium sp.]